MTHFNLASEARALAMMEVCSNGSGETPDASFRILGAFNDCTLGLVRFRGETQWERHPHEELLHVVEGEVDLVFPDETGRAPVTLAAGDVYAVPRTLWHRQVSDGVTLLFATSGLGNEHRAVEATAHRPNESL